MSLASQPMTTSEIEARCIAIIDGHPQRAVVSDDDVYLWVRTVVERHGEQAIWHSIRAGGFGGSEIGVLVRNHQNQRADHQVSARDIVAGKLFKAFPGEETGDLRRGHDNEPRHGEWFYKKYGAERDVGAFESLSKAVGVRPWMRYSPDDVVLIPIQQPNPALGGRNFARYLIDYKAPRRVEEDAEIAFQYACQLHQGAMTSAKTSIHLDGLMLSQFDWAGWCLKDDVVPYDADLARQILDAGDHYWGYVLRGELPRYVQRARFDKQDELALDWAERANRVAQLHAMGKAIDARLKVEAEPIKALVATFRMAGTTMQIGELGISTVVRLDHEAVTAALQQVTQAQYEAALIEHEAAIEAASQGGRPAPAAPRPLDPFEDLQKSLKKKGSASFDADKMEAALRALGHRMRDYARAEYDHQAFYEWAVTNGLDADAFVKEEMRLTPSNGLKDQAQKLVEASFGVTMPAERGSQSMSALTAESTTPDPLGADQDVHLSVDPAAEAAAAIAAAAIQTPHDVQQDNQEAPLMTAAPAEEIRSDEEIPNDRSGQQTERYAQRPVTA